MVKKLFYFLIIGCAVASCTANCLDCRQEKIVEVRLQSCNKTENTKTLYNSVSNQSDWSREDRIGVSESYNGSYDTRSMSYFSRDDDGGTSHTADFSGTLTDYGAGEYELFGIFPYRRESHINNLQCTLPANQYPSATGWDPACDVMIAKSDPMTLSSLGDCVASLSFTHVLGWTAINFSEYFDSCSDYSDELVRAVSITTDKPVAGSFTVDIKGQTIDTKSASVRTVKANYPNASIKAKDLIAYIALFPETYNSATVKLFTDKHTFIFKRGGFTVTRANMLNISISKADGDCLESPEPVFPAMPDEGNTLNILLIGHSYGVNSTTLFPNLLVNAGIDNVYVSRFHLSNASLQQHYDRLINDNAYDGYAYAAPNTTSFTNEEKSIGAVLRERPYDIVVLQTSLENSGRYSTYQPTLNQLIEKINEICLDVHGKKPVFAWQMFWPISVLAESGESELLTSRLSFYNNSSAQMFYDYRMATREMIDDTVINIVIPSGTTIENLRKSPLNTPEVNEFTADMYHLNTKGNYAAACTWFESIIKPIYGISVVGNTFHGSFTDSEAKFVQQAAVNAVNDMFNITYTDSIE